MTGPIKADVAVNIFAKPFQTSLAVLSLLDRSRQHINKIWLQYEPFGSKFDKIGAGIIFEYLRENDPISCEASQPDYWLAREAPDFAAVADPAYRYGIRYQYAWENSSAPMLFIMHNDVYFYKDLLGTMLGQIEDAAAIGEIGQCWNCPASRPELIQSAGLKAPCARSQYQDFRCDSQQLLKLYEEAQNKGVFVRSYNSNQFQEGFQSQPWPLPECRLNEWACLVNLDKTRPLTMPYGDVYPFGAFKPCGNLYLDIAVEWFRGIHAHGLSCKHINVRDYLKHFVGTGKKSRTLYAHSEGEALGILQKRFPDYVGWLKSKVPGAIPG